ncbi:hypothetical protein TVAG_184550 [Trichomonas vaginalis G3]|uniref:Uncharacterized protein n=1 Tax=Trichomonas vaginalis (strain ATCC PRA-98 / G3) TaxID=412133 RepID=A2E9Z1_TRIV3|nr:hypothetical protein TVAGG3_0180960 [Trichomonas vaginalis G3]EAY10553.1 hypothetical protein TVAG_184550 [Trichomonas vaginalis G3]KAI5549284.1 hypothetical protein TVAGG3_0180960 [Trichomonas vaginalis G3]|eukprot:XP_001322776.1 hypothetical protein [Trichomonas vaginalis G3]
MDSISEESNKPLDLVKNDLRLQFEENDDLVRAIGEMTKQIQQKRQATAALVMERNWYLQVISRLNDAAAQDPRLANIAKILNE